MPKFLLLIMDMEYEILKIGDAQKRIIEILIDVIFFSNHKYVLKNIITMPTFNHFTNIINNLDNNLLLNNLIRIHFIIMMIC